MGPVSSTYDSNNRNSTSNLTGSAIRNSTNIIEPMPTRKSALGNNAVIRNFGDI